MKQSIIMLALIVTSFGAFAQKGKVTSAQNLKESGKLEEAIKTIDATIDPSNPKAAKTIPWSKTWEVRGEIYQAIWASKDAAVKKYSDDPLTTALESYVKALELDEKGRAANGIKIKLTLLTNDLTNQAVEAFQAEDYAKALRSFEQIMEVQQIDVVKADDPDAIDTVIMFNAGLAAYNDKNYDKAIEYYGQAANYGYNGARAYSLIANSYQLKGDTTGALTALQTGFEKYPEDTDILNNMIQMYLDIDKTEDAMKYLDMAIKQDPTNTTYLFAQGTLLERLGEEEKAIAVYEKAIEVDANFFNGYYNLGVLYYNKGVKQIEIANSVPANQNEKYQAELKKADIWWEKALPYMEKCDELQPNDNMTLESLKNLYYRTKQMEKYNAILEQLNN